MYHRVKLSRKKRAKKRIRCLFLLVILWAAALYVYFALEGMQSAQADAAREAGVTVCYHGQNRRASASGASVEELLRQLGLTLTAEDVLSHPLDAVPQDGAVISVDLHQRRREVYTEVIPAGTVYCTEPSLELGEERVLSPGREGEMRCTAEVDYVNGIETHRQVITRELLRPVADRVVAQGQGTPQTEPTAGNGYLWLPDGQMLTYTHTASVEATAFTDTDAGCAATAHVGVVEVDPTFISPGTRLYILASDGSFIYGVAQAQASGSMTGSRVDLYLPTQEQCDEFGRRTCTVYFLGI